MDSFIDDPLYGRPSFEGIRFDAASDILPLSQVFFGEKRVSPCGNGKLRALSSGLVGLSLFENVRNRVVNAPIRRSGPVAQALFQSIPPYDELALLPFSLGTAWLHSRIPRI